MADAIQTQSDVISRNQTSSVALIVPIVAQRSPKLTLVYVAAMVLFKGVKGGRDTRGHWVDAVTPLAAYLWKGGRRGEHVHAR